MYHGFGKDYAAKSSKFLMPTSKLFTQRAFEYLAGGVARQVGDEMCLGA